MNTITQKMNLKSRRGASHFGATLWLVTCLIVAALLVWRALPSAAPAAAGPTRLSAVKSGPFAKPIEQVRVGERVAAHNPELDDSDRYFREVDAANWRHLFLRSVKPDGSTLDIELLRDVDWLKAAGAAVGKDIELELEEFGADGAIVLAIAPCPRIAPGTGRIVTGTFAHNAKSVIDVHIAGQTSIGCTDNHLFWSADRVGFVPAGQLRVGENLRTVSHSLAQVLAISARGQPERVYNLEVDVEHAYYVSQAGVLVHNSCPSYQLGKSITAVTGVIRKSTQDSAHVIPHGAFSKRSVEIRTLMKNAQDVVDRAGIPINHRANGDFVERVLHRQYHSDRILRKAATRVIAAEKHGPLFVWGELRAIAAEMVSGDILK